MKSLIVIIILTWNRKNMLRDCLNSIKKNTYYKNYKIVVVDNNSTDGSAEMVKKQFKEVNVIKRKKNKGFSEAYNIAVKYASKKYNPDYFFFLNNDTKVTKNWLGNLIKVSKSSDGSIFGCNQLSFQKKQKQITAGWIRPFGTKYYHGKQIKEVNWVSDASSLVKKEVFEKIGFFDEGLSFYYEETDFERRAVKNGFKIIYVPNSIILHKGGATSKDFDKDFLFYVFHKNRMRCFLKNFPIYYLLPRILYDFFKAIKLKKVFLLLKAYKEGIKSLRY